MRRHTSRILTLCPMIVGNSSQLRNSTLRFALACVSVRQLRGDHQHTARVRPMEPSEAHVNGDAFAVDRGQVQWRACDVREPRRLVCLRLRRLQPRLEQLRDREAMQILGRIPSLSFRLGVGRQDVPDAPSTTKIASSAVSHSAPNSPAGSFIRRSLAQIPGRGLRPWNSARFSYCSPQFSCLCSVSSSSIENARSLIT